MTGSMSGPNVRRFRALFLSDCHLGTRGCQAGLLLDFLRHHEAETIYLVGDIVDGWKLRRGWYWPSAHNAVARELLRRAQNGTRLVYLPGNHDEFLRDYAGASFDCIEVRETAIHAALDGTRLLVIHGDQFDVVVRHARFLAYLGDWAYTAALWLNTYANMARRRLGFPYWSLSAWAKLKVKNAVSFIGAFEAALARAAREHDADGVICGHIHHAAIHRDFGTLYMNCGDWVESCTALGEDEDGQFSILRWTAIAAPGVVVPLHLPQAA